MAEPVYIIPRQKLHEWMGKRCLPPYPKDADTLDCAALGEELVAEVEAMDVWETFKQGLSTSWTNFLKAVDQMGREEDSGKGQGEGLSGDSEEEGKPTVSG